MKSFRLNRTTAVLCVAIGAALVCSVPAYAAGTANSNLAVNASVASNCTISTVAVAFGAYKGASGIAAGLGYAVSDRMRVNAAFSSAPNVSDYGSSVGASFTLN